MSIEYHSLEARFDGGFGTQASILVVHNSLVL